MKKLLLLIFVSFMFFACQSDDSETNNQNLPCAIPENIHISDIESTTVNLIWDNVEGVEWTIEYGEESFVLGNGTQLNSNINEITLTNLSEDTGYDVYIKALCSSGSESEWSDVISFMTNYNCILPTDIQTENILGDSASIVWVNSNYTEEIEIEYGIENFGLGNGTVVTSNTNSFDLTNLMSNQNYGFYIRTKCTNATYSEWSDVYSFSTTCNAFNGDVNLTTQQEVNDFVASFNCSIIDGRLTIGTSPDTDITDISSLSFLETVTNGIIIRDNSQLTSLQGLENITSTQFLYINDNDNLNSLVGLEGITELSLTLDDNDNLTSLNGLNNVTEIQGLSIVNNPALLSIDSFPNLTSSNIVGSVRIENCASLNDIDGLSSISSVGANFQISNTGLNSFNSLQSLTTIGGRLIISQNPSITSLNGFHNLQSSQTLEIIGMDNVSSVGFNSLNTLTTFISNSSNTVIGLTLQGNDNLTDISTLSNLVNVSKIAIYLNDSLTTLNGLQGVTQLNKGLLVSNNPVLTSIAGLENITSVNEKLEISFNPVLSISQLSNLTTVGQLNIRGLNISNLNSLSGLSTINGKLILVSLPNITSLSGLDNITNVNGEVHVSSNNSLSSLSNLASLTSVTYTINIKENPVLSNLNGLEQLTNFQDFDIRDNTSLSNFCALTNPIVNGNHAVTPIYTSGNQYNPTNQNIIDGNCSN